MDNRYRLRDDGTCESRCAVMGVIFTEHTHLRYSHGAWRDDNGDPVEIERVVHAHWVWNPNGNDWGIGAWCCSNCGGKNDALPWDNKLNPYAFACSHYCPVCGAHMDEEVDHV